MRWIALFIVFAAAAAALAVHQSWIRLPPNALPWDAVTLEAPPRWFARIQLNALAADADACLAALDGSKLAYTRIADRPVKDGCGLTNGVVIDRSNVAYSRAFQSTCPLTAALYWYEQSLAHLAETLLGTKIIRIEHLGSYACRNVNARETGRRSQHATANALDIAGFKFADGSEVTVLRDWDAEGPRGQFVRAAHREACRFFNVTLGPGYNRLHADHFHVDMGRSRVCR